MQEKKYVINALGEKELFSERKLLQSLKRSGASNDVANRIWNNVSKNIFSGIKTSEIFKLIKTSLEKEHSKVALRFGLKESIRGLGPAGFFFEKYIAEIFKQYGYEIKINQIVSGKCVKYEIDIIARNKKTIYLGECKYRNKAGEKIDISVCLKEFALLYDIRNGNYFVKNPDYSIQSLIITNTKFTEQSIKYAECEGIYLLGWRYPKEGGLEKLIEDKKLYPITILPSFKKELMNFFVNENMMMVKDILRVTDIAKFAQTAKISKKSIQDLYNDARVLLEN
ncbi:MAG: restriction endonuclease [Candidatus Pacebacteria bacterium]|nr:restriction endonuclease [Candidatus Paceibacterota bacterium]